GPPPRCPPPGTPPYGPRPPRAVEPQQPTRHVSRSIGLPAAGALHWDAPAPRALSCLSLLGWLYAPLADGGGMALSPMLAGACAVLLRQAIAGGHIPAKTAPVLCSAA